MASPGRANVAREIIPIVNEYDLCSSDTMVYGGGERASDRYGWTWERFPSNEFCLQLGERFRWLLRNVKKEI